MIFRETPIAQGISGEDLREKEGYALKLDASGNLIVCTSATDIPIGVVHMGGEEGRTTTYIRHAHPGIVGVALTTEPGTVKDGTPLVVTAGGTWKAKPASGACVVGAYACEAGEGEQLAMATLCTPQVVA